MVFKSMLLRLFDFFVLFQCFSLRPGSTVHCIYVFSAPPKPWPKPWPKTLAKTLAKYLAKTPAASRDSRKVCLEILPL